MCRKNNKASSLNYPFSYTKNITEKQKLRSLELQCPLVVIFYIGKNKYLNLPTFYQKIRTCNDFAYKKCVEKIGDLPGTSLHYC